jgi:hypothetical protein
MKEPERNGSYKVWCLIFFQISELFDYVKNHEYEPFKNRRDNCQGSVPVFDNWPTWSDMAHDDMA